MSVNIEPANLTTADVAKILGYTPWTIRQLVAKGKIPHYKMPSGQYRFKESEVKKFLISLRRS